MNLSSYQARASSKGSAHRRPQQPGNSTLLDSTAGLGDRLDQQPGAFRVLDNRPSDNNDIVSMEYSTVVPPHYVAEDSVVRVPEAQLVLDPGDTEAAIARALKEAREQNQADMEAAIARAQAENERAIQRAVQAERERRAVQETQPIVREDILQDNKDESQDPEDEERKPTFRMPAFIRKHAVLSCALCSLVLFGAIGAGIGVALSSSSSSSSKQTSFGDGITGVPTTPPATVESTPTPAPLSLEEPTARTPPTPGRIESTFNPTEKPTPQPTRKLTLRPAPRPTPNPTPRPTAAPFIKTTAPPIPSTVVGITSWTQVGSTLMGVATGDRFGDFNELALSSDGFIVAVGAHSNDDVASSAGRVQVFQRSAGGMDQPQATEWQPMGAALKGFAGYDRFGNSVALSFNGQILAVGATENSQSRTGSVHVVEYDNTINQWNSRGSKIVGIAERDSFGSSVALSFDGNTLAVGAPFNDDNGDDAGHVRVFLFDSNTNKWVQQGSTLTGVASFDFFGYSLELSADGAILAVGAWGNDDNGSSSGHVRAFKLNSNSNDWDPLGEAIPGMAKGDQFGRSVALSSNGMVLAAGAEENDDNGIGSGHVRVFDYNTSSNQWIQRGSAIVGVAEGDSFGYSVALSADGNQVAAGAALNDAIASASGHVRVFQYEPSSDGTTIRQWKQVGEALTGVGGEDDFFGSSVAMSADGSVVAGGATEINEGPGYVCVYEGVVE